MVSPQDAKRHSAKSVQSGVCRTASPSAGREPRLDGIRGLAVLYVVVFHLGKALTLDQPAVFLTRQAMDVLWVGVDLFFVLSGYLITGILLDTRSSTNYFTSFYARRSLRIFPPYYLFLALVSVSSLAVDGMLPEHLEYFLFYVSNWQSSGPAAAGHLWSLAIEEQYYLIWPVVIRLAGVRRLAAICIALFLFTNILRASLLLLDVPAAAAWCYYNTLCRLDGLALGSLIACAARNPAFGGRLDRYAPTIAFASGAVILTIIAWEGGFRNSWPLVQIAGYGACAIAFACAVWFCTRERFSRWSFLTMFESDILQSIGKYSYGIYVFHYPVANLLNRSPAGAWLNGSTEYWLWRLLLWLAGGIAICYGLGWLSFHLFEKHFLRFKEYFRASQHGNGAAAAHTKGNA